MFFFLLFQTSLSLDSNILGDVSVSGTFSCSGLSTSTLTSPGSVSSSSSVTSSDTSSTTTRVSELTLSSLYPQDSKITIDSDLIIYPSSTSTSFYQLNWHLFSHNSFEDSSEGWSGERVECSSDFYMKGDSKARVFKQVKLPPGSYVRLTASVHMIDDWQGETIALKVDGKVLWAHQGTSGTMNLCGSDKNDAAFGVSVDVSFEYSSGSLEFVSDVAKGSFGVDNVIIYVK